jgi:hypothetical protein
MMKTLHPVCIGCIMIALVETPSTPPFIGKGGGRVYMEDLIGYGSTWPRLYLYLPYLQDLIP